MNKGEKPVQPHKMATSINQKDKSLADREITRLARTQIQHALFFSYSLPASTMQINGKMKFISRKFVNPPAQSVLYWQKVRATNKARQKKHKKRPLRPATGQKDDGR